jgi:drug/metabolite transporter (DMT)-like permease
VPDTTTPAPAEPAGAPSAVAPAGPVINELHAGLFMLAAATCFAFAFAAVKYMTTLLPETVVTLWRSIFAVLVFLPMVWRAGPRHFLATARPFGHVTRASLGFASFILLVFGLARLPLGDAIALGFTAPFWSVILGVVVFRDKMTWRLALAVIAGFFGVLLITQPGFSGDHSTRAAWGAACALSSAVLTTLAMMMVKQLTRSEPPDRIAFYFMLGASVLSLPLAGLDWQWPAPEHWLYLFLCGAGFYVGQVCLTRAYAYGTFSRVAPLDLARLPLSVLIGLAWFHEVPNTLALAGMALIILASLDILIANWRKKS